MYSICKSELANSTENLASFVYLVTYILIPKGDCTFNSVYPVEFFRKIKLSNFCYYTVSAVLVVNILVFSSSPMLFEVVYSSFCVF